MAASEAHVSSASRPQRFALRLPVWYRTTDERDWHTGVTESISLTGATIRPDDPIMPTGRLVVAISLPAVPGCLVGRGRIVRKLAAAHPGHATFVVAIDRYRIGRRDAILRSTKP